MSSKDTVLESPFHSPKSAWYNISKTTHPRLPDHLVRREVLLNKLNMAVDGQASYLLAPAGYGKSTLLSQWYHDLIEQRVACAWLNLDKSDEEITSFFAYLILALEGAGVSTGSLKEQAEGGFDEMSATSVGSDILTLFGGLTRKTVIILDDYHLVSSTEIDDFLHAAQRCGFGMVHFSFASRDKIGGNSPALIASGNAVVIDARELKFTEDEIVQAIGEELDLEMLQMIQEKVEGWPFAIQMTRILAQTAGLNSAITSLCGHQGHIAEYLTSQVVENLSEESRDFVMKTSLFERFNVELADEVCCHNNSYDSIMKMNMLNSFIVKVRNDDDEWYRYHHLLADCLRNLSKQDEGIDVESIYRRSIKWFESQGYVAEAVKYANKIEDHDLSGEIVKNNGGWAIALSINTDCLRKVMSTIPEAEIQKDARLMLAKAYLYYTAGEFRKAQTYCNSANLLIVEDDVPIEVELDRLCVGSAVMGKSELSFEHVSGSLEERLDQVKGYGSFYQGFIQVILANEQIMHGDFPAATKSAESAYLALQSGAFPVGAGHAHLPIAMSAFYQGDFDEARRQFGLAVKMTETINGPHDDVARISSIGIHATDYWQGKLEGEETAVLYEELDSIFRADGGFNSFIVGTEALFHYAISSKNVTEAQRLIDTLFIVNMRYGISRIEKYCDILQLELCLYQGQLAKAEIHYSKIQKWHSKKDSQREECYWYLDISAGYARAQFLAAIGYADEAISHIDNAIEIGMGFGVVPIVLRGEILKASIFHSIGDISNARVCLQDALSTAAPLQMRQVFTEAYIPSQLIGMVRENMLESEQSPLVKEFIEQVYLSSQDGLLNDRERDVLVGISNGMTNKEIARMLDLTESTIKFHQRKLYKKFGVSKRVSAVSKARELNMLM